MTDEVQVAIRVEEGVTIIDLTGNITDVAREPINQAYETVSANNVKNITFNFIENDYINSAGIAIFVGIAAKARHRQQKLSMTNLSPHYQRIFRTIGLKHLEFR